MNNFITLFQLNNTNNCWHIEDNLFKKYKEDFLDIDHILKSQMAKMFSLQEEDLRFLPETSEGFERILDKSRKIATANFTKDYNRYNLELYTCAGIPLILDTTCETSYLVIRTLDID